MKILLVEDNVSLCRNIASVLQNEGYTVVTCSNGNVAEFQMLNNSSDLILLDRMLPGKDGITLTREARAAGITVPILLLTALDTLGDKSPVLMRGQMIISSSLCHGGTAGPAAYLVAPHGIP